MPEQHSTGQKPCPEVWLIPAGDLFPHPAAAIRSANQGDPRGAFRCTNRAWLTEAEVKQYGQRLIPARPLLELLSELDQLATEAGRVSEEAEVWVRSATDRLCTRLGFLLGETFPEVAR